MYLTEESFRFAECLSVDAEGYPVLFNESAGEYWRIQDEESLLLIEALLEEGVLSEGLKRALQRWRIKDLRRGRRIHTAIHGTQKGHVTTGSSFKKAAADIKKKPLAATVGTGKEAAKSVAKGATSGATYAAGKVGSGAHHVADATVKGYKKTKETTKKIIDAPANAAKTARNVAIAGGIGIAGTGAYLATRD